MLEKTERDDMEERFDSDMINTLLEENTVIYTVK
jgi:hypothetical protein